MRQRLLTEEVLDKTMNLFWEKGYFNTTIEDIIEATGLNRAALYKYVGDKETLFLKMLERFRKNITDQATIPLQGQANGIEGIKIFFSQFLELYESKNLRSRGCFLISTASDIHSHNKEVARFIEGFYQDLTKLFRNQFVHTKNQGLLKPEVEIDSVVDFLIGNLFGSMSLCRSSAHKQIFENHVNGVICYLSNISVQQSE
jgi:TetR/AcrR family transcriptional repressor of nem operon